MLAFVRRLEPLRYLMVGAFAALLQNAIMILSDRAGLHFMVGNVLCYLIVGSLTYVLHSRVTFRRDRSWNRYLRFMAGMLSAFFVASLLFFLLCAALDAPMTIAAPSVTVAMIVYNYLSARWAIVWAKRRASSVI